MGDEGFAPLLPKYVPYLLHFDVHSHKSDFNAKKASIDFIYALIKQMPLHLSALKDTLSQLLGNLKFDRVKPVRDSCIETLKALKTVPELQVEPKTTQILKKARRSKAERKKTSSLGDTQDLGGLLNQQQQDDSANFLYQSITSRNGGLQMAQDEMSAPLVLNNFRPNPSLVVTTGENNETEVLENYPGVYSIVESTSKLSSATQKRRDARKQPKIQRQTQRQGKKEHRSVLRGSINQDFIESQQQVPLPRVEEDLSHQEETKLLNDTSDSPHRSLKQHSQKRLTSSPQGVPLQLKDLETFGEKKSPPEPFQTQQISGFEIEGSELLAIELAKIAQRQEQIVRSIRGLRSETEEKIQILNERIDRIEQTRQHQEPFPMPIQDDPISQFKALLSRTPVKQVHLLKLMSQTGPCFGILDTKTIKLLIDQFIILLQKRLFIEAVIPWISQLSDMLKGKLKISDRQLETLVECLIEIIGQNTLSHKLREQLVLIADNLSMAFE